MNLFNRRARNNTGYMCNMGRATSKRSPQFKCGAYTVQVRNGILIANDFITSDYCESRANLYGLNRQGIINEVFNFVNDRGKKATTFAVKVADYVESTR